MENFIDPHLFNLAADNLGEEVDDFHEQLQVNFAGEIDELIDNLYQKLNISTLLSEVETSIKEKTAAEVLGREKTENITDEFLARGAQFIQSKEGKQLLSKLLNKLLELLKGIDYSVLDLLADYFDNSLENFLQDELPEIVEKIIDWLKDNKGEIERLIEDSIQEEMDKGFGASDKIRNTIKKGIYNLVYDDDFAREHNIFGKLIEGIQNDVDTKELSRDLTKRAVKFLSEESIGEIIQLLEDKEIIKVNELVSLLQDNVDNSISSLNFNFFDRFFTTQLI